MCSLFLLYPRGLYFFFWFVMFPTSNGHETGLSHFNNVKWTMVVQPPLPWLLLVVGCWLLSSLNFCGCGWLWWWPLFFCWCAKTTTGTNDNNTGHSHHHHHERESPYLYCCNYTLTTTIWMEQRPDMMSVSCIVFFGVFLRRKKTAGVMRPSSDHLCSRPGFCRHLSTPIVFLFNRASLHFSCSRTKK